MIEQDKKDRDFGIVKSHAARLAEHFESVQIFVTRQSEDGTINCNWGQGNWYARYGQVKAWTVFQEGELNNPKDDDE